MTDIILKNFELLDPEIGELKSGYEILISGGEIKKVVKALKKASKAHAGQAKILKGVINGGSKKRNG